jgi:hypothetical protein
MSWEATTNALEYILRYRAVGGILTFDSIATDQLNVVIEDLDPCTAYEMQVRAVCGGDDNGSDYSPLMTFQTDCASSVLSVGGKPVQYAVYPNPFADRAQLELQLPAGTEVGLSLFSIAGQEVWRQEMDLGSGAHQITVDPARELPSGIYFLRLRVGEQHSTLKLVKE